MAGVVAAPEDNFALVPQVIGAPYGYGVDGMEHAATDGQAGGDTEQEVR